MPANGKAEESGTHKNSISGHHERRRPSPTQTETRKFPFARTILCRNCRVKPSM